MLLQIGDVFVLELRPSLRIAYVRVGRYSACLVPGGSCVSTQRDE